MNDKGLKPSGPMGTNLNVDDLSLSGYIGSDIDYWASLVGGGALATYGVVKLLEKPSVINIAATLVGGGLVYRGLTGLVYNDEMSSSYLGGLRNPAAATQHLEGIKIEQSIVVNRPPHEIYQVWRNFENLPRIMEHLESVEELNDVESHWTVQAPGGMTVEWDAEVYMEKVDELISWRSAENADVPNAGSVRFEPVREGEACKITVMLKYDPPMGPLGAALATLLGENPGRQISSDLKRFKQAMEGGEFTAQARYTHSTNGHHIQNRHEGNQST